MRDQLNEANKRVTLMKNDVRSAERDLSASEQDKDALRKSLACNVSKIESLIRSARSMGAHRAAMKESINVLRRKKKSAGGGLCFLCFCLACLILI
jgi:hypothetical protein